MEKNLLKYDQFGSSYGWRILMNEQFDYRKVRQTKFIVEGFSKWLQIPEAGNKKTVLLNVCSMLFDKRWIYKSDGILIYEAGEGGMMKPLAINKRIIHFSKVGDDCHWSVNELIVGQYCCDRIEKMVDYYNKGNQRGLK